MAATVFIFIKPPRMGLAKTRLARGLGKTEARRVARFTMEKSLRAASDPRWTAVISTAPLASVRAEFTPNGRNLKRVPQGPGDLGDRLTRAHHMAPPGPVLFIGGDAPDISKALLWRAIRATRPGHAAIGPAADGGFWLLGLWKGLAEKTPFDEVRWSTGHALSDVLDNLPKGTKTHALPTLIDIDEADDWAAWRASASL